MLGRRLGEGGSGAVYEALDVERNVDVALKTLRRQDADSLARFKREFRTAADLAHPNLAKLYELWEEEGWWFITMELVHGVDFLTYVGAQCPGATTTAPMDAVEEHGPPFNEHRLRHAMMQLAAGLSALHDAGIVHRDVKPSNVRVTEDGRVVLLDFGLAVGMHDASPVATGTPRYMAPEQCTSTPAATAADWYSLGIMLYEALCGHAPFAGATDDVLFNKQHFRPPSPSSFVERVPSDLDALAVDLLAADPLSRPTAAEILARLAVSRSTSHVASPRMFVGREAELASLAAAFDERLAGGSALVRVCGESGLGKTALLDAFAERIEDAGRAWVLRGRCMQRELVPFRGLDGALDDLASRLTVSPFPIALHRDTLAVLGHAFPALRRAPALQTTVVDSLAHGREIAPRVGASLIGLLGEVAQQHPIIVAIDDLHWAALDTLALLNVLLAAPPPNVLVVVATRDPREPVLAPGREVTLGPLSMEETTSLVRSLVSDHQDVATIARETGGRPLFAVQLARHAANGRGRPGSITIEDTIHDSVRRLDPGTGQLLTTACIAHAPIDFDTAAAVTGMPRSSLLDALATLRAHRLIRTFGVGAGERFEPYHDRVRQAVAGALDREASRACHLAIATALEGASASDAEGLALHWFDAGFPGPAAGHALLAAEQASRAFAFHRAARLYAWVIALGVDAIDARRVRVKLAEALSHAGLGIEAAETFLACSREADGIESLGMKRLAMQQLLVMGHADRALALLDELMAVLDLPNPTRSSSVAAALVARRGALRFRRLRFRAPTAAKVNARDRARIDLTWDAAAGLAMVDTLRSSYLHALNLDLSFRFGDRTRLARAVLGEAPFLANGGHPTRRLEHVLGIADSLATDSGIPAISQLARGTTAFLMARWREAHERLSEAEQLLVASRPQLVEEAFGLGQVLSMLRAMPVGALFFLGRLDRLAHRTPELLRDALERNDVAAATYLRTGTQSHLWLALGDVGEAIRHADEGAMPWRSSRAVFPHVMDLQARVAIELYCGGGATVHSMVVDSWPRVRAAHLMRSHYVRTTLLDARGRAAVAAARSARDSSAWLRDARACASRLREGPSTWSIALGRALEAGIARLSGRSRVAETAATEAIAAFHAAEMPLHAASVAGDHTTLARLGVVDAASFARTLCPVEHR